MHLSARKPRVPAVQKTPAAAAATETQPRSKRQRLLDRLHLRTSRGVHGGDARPDDADVAAEAAAPSRASTPPAARPAHAFDYFHRAAPTPPTTPSTPAPRGVASTAAASVPVATPKAGEGQHFFAHFHRPSTPGSATPPAPAEAVRPPLPAAVPTGRRPAFFGHLRHPLAAERAPLLPAAAAAEPIAPTPRDRAPSFWRSYGSFVHRAAQPSAAPATRARPAAAVPPTTVHGAVDEVQAHPPAHLLAPVRALDAAFARAQVRGRARLDGLLDAAADAERPRALVGQYVRERCALRAGEATAGGLLALRNATVERGGRAAATWTGRRVGQGVAWGAAGPLLLVERSAAPARVRSAGNAAADAATWPGHGVVTLASVGLAVVALACGGTAAAVGMAAGYVVAGAILALVPTAVLHGWLRGRALERAAHRRADSTMAWLREHFGEAPTTPGPRLQSLEARPPRAARVTLSPTAWDAVTAEDAGYAQDVAHAVAYVAQPPAAIDDQVALAEEQMERSVAQMPAPLRLLLGATADGQLAEAHRELADALGEARRQRNAERIYRQRLAAAAASEAAAREAPPPASVDSPQLAE